MRRLDWRYLVGALVLLAVLVYYSGPDVAQMTYALVLLDLAAAVVAIVRGARRRQYGLLAGAPQGGQVTTRDLLLQIGGGVVGAGSLVLAGAQRTPG